MWHRGKASGECVWRGGAAKASIFMARKPNHTDDADQRGGIVTKTEPKTKRPSLYKVLLLNDDYTPMDFVVYILERFFNKPSEEANRIMMHVHQKGVGICGVYTYEVAETKVAQVTNFSRQHQHPLQCTMEKE
jgi:ATP-dependent Clp protease adaptor protein ClpS